MKALLVTGSRHGLDQTKLGDSINEYIKAFIEDVDLVIHGNAPGVDTEFEEACVWHCVHTLPMSACWDEHGPAAGPIRNTHMVNLAYAMSKSGWEVKAMAFPGPKSTGTTNCIKRIKEKGFDLKIEKVGL